MSESQTTSASAEAAQQKQRYVQYQQAHRTLAGSRWKSPSTHYRHTAAKISTAWVLLWTSQSLSYDITHFNNSLRHGKQNKMKNQSGKLMFLWNPNLQFAQSDSSQLNLLSKLLNQENNFNTFIKSEGLLHFSGQKTSQPVQLTFLVTVHGMGQNFTVAGDDRSKHHCMEGNSPPQRGCSSHCGRLRKPSPKIKVQ